jgi:hypothetical protein
MMSSHCDVNVCVTDSHSVISPEWIALKVRQDPQICADLSGSQDKVDNFLAYIRGPGNVYLVNKRVSMVMGQTRSSQIPNRQDPNLLVEQFPCILICQSTNAP